MITNKTILYKHDKQTKEKYEALKEKYKTKKFYFCDGVNFDDFCLYVFDIDKLIIIDGLHNDEYMQTLSQMLSIAKFDYFEE